MSLEMDEQKRREVRLAEVLGIAAVVVVAVVTVLYLLFL